MEAKDSEPPSIIIGEDGEASWRGVGIRNLAMEMGAQQEKCPAPSMSEIRKWEARKKCKGKEATRPPP
jgi:hypothetical protein